jgi:hypothetical protein
MIWFLIGTALTITIVNLLFFFVGYWAGRGTLVEKVKQIIKLRQPEETSGPVKALNPEDLAKKKSHQLWEKYMG